MKKIIFSFFIIGVLLLSLPSNLSKPIFPPCIKQEYSKQLIKNKILKLNSNTINSYKLSEIIRRESIKNNISPELILAIIKVESNFDENAKSPKNARGLMQIRKIVLKDLKMLINHKELYNSETNIKIGTLYLAKLIKRFNSVEKALNYYNSGSIKRTSYSKKVLRVYNELM